MSSYSVVMVGFRDTQLSVDEDDGTANLVVTMIKGQLERPITVFLSIADGTANGKINIKAPLFSGH